MSDALSDNNDKIRDRIRGALEDAIAAGELSVAGATVMVNNFLMMVDVIVDDNSSPDTRNPLLMFASSDAMAMNLGLHNIAGLMLNNAAIRAIGMG